MTSLLWAIGASIVVSAISLIGIFTFLLNERLLDKALILLIGFSAGGLIGGAFLHLLPEALEKSGGIDIFIYLILGFVLFFILERYLLWHHCHEGKCDIHPFSYLNLVGDSIHNFIDGLVIGASFVVNIHFGIITTIVVILHEIPQEMGDFAILVYGGFDRYRALTYNFLTALFAILGSIGGYYFSDKLEICSKLILPFAAGGFLYIASCDLIPELHKQADLNRARLSMAFFILGILFMLLMKFPFASLGEFRRT